MAYYAALISLKLTIRRLLYSSQLSILPASVEMLRVAHGEVGCFEKFLQANEGIIIGNSNNERVKSLNEQIRDAAHKLEDALESHVYNQSEGLGDEGFSQEIFLDLEEVNEEINSFIETVHKIEKMMREAARKPLLEEDAVVPPKIDFRGKDSKMVGLSEDFIEFKNLLLNHLLPGCDVVLIVGMAGIGKTTFAIKMLEDPLISSFFDLLAFVTIGQKYQFREVMLSILIQMDHDIDEIRMEENKKLAEHVRISLQGRKYLIVLDDVWNTEDLKDLLSLFPSNNNGGIVLLTTRQEQVADGYVYQMRFLNKKESWDLLREKVFGEGNLCPFQLEKPGKKIAENCEGLPLAIITVADILSKGEKTLEYWEKVAKKENSVFADAYDQLSPVLIPSYNYLPQYLKPCFLYMGVFPQSYEIPVSHLIKLWRAEGFVDFSPWDLEDIGRQCLGDLLSESTLLATQQASRSRGYAKSCKLHSVFWHLCVKQASSEKFLHVINRYASSFAEDIKYQQRLCIHNNVLFGIKEVYNSMDSISTVHSLLCTGPYHQYPVPICFGLRLLRVLDALTIRFYKFPIELLKLVRLRYLALTYSGKIPGSISKLRNLEHLIVFRHRSINKSSRDSSYLPMEIWNMKELRHIQVKGNDLQDPCGATLPNLLTLSSISASSCRKEILERIPNLKKLGIQIELTPDVVEPLCCFDHLSNVRYLESLRCVVVNPKLRSQAIAPITTFPYHLIKLSLSGLGYLWKYMRIIGQMPKLEVLKLRCYAFQGPVWEVNEREFPQLRYLLVEDTDLVHWRSDKSRCFPLLQCLIIRHCYKLKEIPLSFGINGGYGPNEMELVDCPPFGASIRGLERKYACSTIHVRSSLDDEDES